MTARQWGQSYEWNAHYPLAIDEGFSADMAQAIAEGRRPEGMVEEEEILYDFCMELQRNRSVSDATYERAVERFGEQGVVEIVSVIGYYTMVSMISNTSRAPLPAGATPALAPFPHRSRVVPLALVALRLATPSDAAAHREPEHPRREAL